MGVSALFTSPINRAINPCSERNLYYARGEHDHMVNTFDWIEIRTGDIEKTAAFYENLFGWKVVQKIDAEGSPYWI
ncbi:MAG: VOC family protein, partial [Methanomicrobia archaeon]|nr:VOC family protein [Methanomicrobia archaeon]